MKNAKKNHYSIILHAICMELCIFIVMVISFISLFFDLLLYSSILLIYSLDSHFIVTSLLIATILHTFLGPKNDK